MSGKRILIAAISLLTLIFWSCNKEDEETMCQWFPAQMDSVYTNMFKDITPSKTIEDTVNYNTQPTNNSINFDGVVFQSDNCETMTVSVNGGARIPARAKNLGTVKLFDEPVGDMIFNAWQSDTVKPKTLNGFTYTNATQSTVLWKHKSGYPNGEIIFWFAHNIGVLAVYNTSRPTDTQTIYTNYELK